MRSFIDGERREGESFSTALTRFSLEARVSLPTLWAAVRGARVNRGTAARIEEASGGALLAEDLINRPRRAELGVGTT